MGFFLEIMQKLNYETHGQEISAFASEYASKNLNSNIFNGDLFSANYKKNYFDIITMWDVLEHLKEPEKTLKEINRILRKNGVLIIETLNTNTLCNRVYRENWPLYYPPYHIYYFNNKMIRNILNHSGFKIIKTFPIQTYIKIFNRFKTIRYFNIPIIRDTFGKLFNDVICYIVVK